ncbi:MAG: hypothetical protein ACRC8Y_04500 [Chroococcales cyanobacterium]
MMPAMSQGRTSPNHVPLQTDCLSDAQLAEREKMLRMAANPNTARDLLCALAQNSDRLIRKTIVHLQDFIGKLLNIPQIRLNLS